MTSTQTQDYYRDNASARLSALIIVCIGSFLTPLALSAALVATPEIARDLKADAVLVSWIPAIFLLCNLITLLPSGRAADSYGRKRIYNWGSIIFLIASIGSGLSYTIEMLLFFRGLQGIGAAMFFGNGFAIISSVYRSGGRGAALGWVVSCVYLGMSAGPLFGGWVTEHFGWHFVFLAMVPFVLLAIIMTVVRLKGEWISDTPQKLDWFGVVILASWIITLFLGLTNLPDLFAILSLVVSGIILYWFVKRSDDMDAPLIKLRLVWENQRFSRLLLAATFIYAGSYGVQFLIGLYLQYNLGQSPSEAGQYLLVQAILMAVIAPVAGRLSDRYPSYLLATCGAASVVISFTAALFLNDHSSIWLVIMSLAFLGIGFGLFSTPNNSGAMGAVSEARQGIASALVNMARLLGQLFGTAMVTMLMSMYIGDAEIEPDYYDELLTVLHWTVMFSLSCAVIAMLASFSMRNIEPRNPEAQSS